MSARRFCLAGAAAFALSGCYRYQSLSSAELRPELVVRVTLSRAATASLAPTIGPGAKTLDGRLLAVTPTAFLLALTQIERIAGPEQFLDYDPIAIPIVDADAIVIRSLDKPRTALAVAAVLAGVIAANKFVNRDGIFTSKTGPASAIR